MAVRTVRLPGVVFPVLILAALLALSALSPIAPTADAQGQCGNAPPPRLIAGGQGRVASDDGTPNNLRANPSANAVVLGTLDSGEVFSVISGPQCAEGLNWWQVRRASGQTGWTAEGSGGEYWVEPWPQAGATTVSGQVPALPGLQIAYLSGVDQTLVPHVMGADGSQPRPVTNTPGSSSPLVWSPDGTRIAFSDGVDLYIALADGTLTANLTNSPASAESWPTWSPDSQRIAYMSQQDTNEDIFRISANGQDAVNLTNNPASDGWPAWSPDGTRIAFASDRNGTFDIFVMDAASGASLQPATNSPASEIQPVWARNSLWLAYLSKDGPFSNLGIIDQDGARLLTTDANVTYFAWSPDNERIAYIAEAPVGSGNYEVFSVRVETGDIFQYTTSGGSAVGVSWSPGGAWIVYANDSSGNFEVYGIRANGLGLARLTNAASVDIFPVFMPPTVPNLPDEAGSAAADVTPGDTTDPNPAEEDLLLIYNTTVPVFTLQNVSGGPLNLTPLSFSGEGRTVPSDVWADYTASPLGSFKNLGCLMLWPFNLPEQPAPPECGDARQGWITNSALTFWTGGTFTVSYNNVVIATCDSNAGRCVIDLP